DVAEDNEVGDDTEHSPRSHECFHEILVVSGYLVTPVVERFAVGIPCCPVEELVQMGDRKELQDSESLRSLFVVSAYLNKGFRHSVTLRRRLSFDEDDGDAVDEESDVQPDCLSVRSGTEREF